MYDCDYFYDIWAEQYFVNIGISIGVGVGVGIS